MKTSTRLVVFGTICALTLMAATLYFSLGTNRSPTSVANVGRASHASRSAQLSTNQQPSFSVNPAANRQEVAARIWTERFRGSGDYSSFVSDALPYAIKGDGRASYYIAVALQSCASIMRKYHGVEDPEALLNAELTSSPKGPQWTKDLHAANVHRCLGLAQRDAFSELPPGPTYNASYWFDAAVEDGDALAEVHEASKTLAELSVSTSLPSDARAVKIEAAGDELKKAIASGGPDVLFSVGMAIANSPVVSDPEQGIAIALTACDVGYDCSDKNPDNVFATCRLSGACPADTDYSYFVQQSVGQTEFAELYAKSQVLKQSFMSGDTDALAASVKIGKP